MINGIINEKRFVETHRFLPRTSYNPPHVRECLYICLLIANIIYIYLYKFLYMPRSSLEEKGFQNVCLCTKFLVVR